MQKYCHVQSNLRLTHFKYFHEQTLHVEGNKTPKTNFYRFIWLLNLDTECMISRTDRYLKQHTLLTGRGGRFFLLRRLSPGKTFKLKEQATTSC